MKRRISVLGLFGTIVVAVLLLLSVTTSTTAGAQGTHSNFIQLSGTCDTATGMYNIAGTVTNNFLTPGVSETVTVFSESPPGLASSGFPVDLGPGATGHFSGQVPGTTGTSATLIVRGMWTDGITAHSVGLPLPRLLGDCAVAAPPETTVPPTTTPPGDNEATEPPGLPESEEVPGDNEAIEPAGLPESEEGEPAVAPAAGTAPISTTQLPVTG